MSETTTDPVVETATEAPEGVEAVVEGQERGETEAVVEATPEPEAKERRTLQARVARLTRERGERDRELALARSEIEMLKAGKAPDPVADATALTQRQIDEAADRKIAERETAQARADLIAAGVKEMTAAVWDQKTETLRDMGALAAPGFLDALFDIPEAPRLVAYLADEPDELAALLAKSPTKMATAMGRMAERLSVETPKQISKVAAPVRTVGPGRVAPPPDVTKMTAKEYIAFREKTAPKHLGGRGQAA